jgi:hypothetical protein
MRANEMRARIEAVLAKLREAAQGTMPTAYLPDIIESLEAMLENLDAPRERRDRMAGALGYIVLDDFAFAESALGGEVLEITDAFASF